MADNFAPYAPTKAVLAVLERFRERGLPDPLTIANLEQIGVPASNAPRTLQALRFLGLVDEGGNRMPLFNALRQAKTDEYPAQLAEIVRNAYLPIFTIVDPASDSDIAISDAFRGYEPASTREKMVSLFMGLCRAAGIVTGKPTRHATSTGDRRPAAVRGPARTVSRSKASAPPAPGQLADAGTYGKEGAVLFSVYEEDLALLGPEERKRLWDALGDLMLARVAARQRQPGPGAFTEDFIRSFMGGARAEGGEAAGGQ